MEGTEKDHETTQQDGMAHVSPADSPSENYIVAESLQRMPSVFSRGLVYIVVLAVASAVAYSLLAKIDIVVSSSAVARPAAHKIRILSDRTGYIEKISIAEGEAVEKSAPLFLIRSKDTLACRAKVEELRRAIPLKNQQYETRISAAEDELKHLGTDHRNLLDLKKLKLEQNELSLQATGTEVAYWDKVRGLLTEDLASARALREQGITAKKELNYAETRLENANTQLKKLAAEKKIAMKEKEVIAGEIKKAKADYGSRTIILEKQIKNLRLEMQTTLASMQKELETNEKMLALDDGSCGKAKDEDENEKVIRAENAGTVSELCFRTVGSYVRESDLLCTILPAGSPLYMDITVANKDIGFIEEGTKIKYKFAAFPHTDYGLLHGKVTALSPSAVEDSVLGFVYHVRGDLDTLHYEIKGKRYPIKPGMTAKAELVTKRKSIFAILFKRLRE